MTHCAAFYRYVKNHFWNQAQAECTTSICKWCGIAQRTGNDVWNYIDFMDQHFQGWLERWEERAERDDGDISPCLPLLACNVLRRLFDKDPDLFNQVMLLITELNTTPEVQRVIADIRFAEAEATPPPEGIYSVVVVDPPWKSITGDYEPTKHRGPPNYATMSVSEIEEWGKKRILPCLAPDAIVWLWVVNYYLHDAFHLLESWDLEYKAIFVWVKPHMGIGSIVRNRAEFCLLAFKGSPHWYNTTEDNIIEAPTREHSRKPDEFYELVDTLCAGSKLDMFAREPREGWDVWGAEVELFA